MQEAEQALGVIPEKKSLVESAKRLTQERQPEVLPKQDTGSRRGRGEPLHENRGWYTTMEVQEYVLNNKTPTDGLERTIDKSIEN